MSDLAVLRIAQVPGPIRYVSGGPLLLRLQARNMKSAASSVGWDLRPNVGLSRGCSSRSSRGCTFGQVFVEAPHLGWSFGKVLSLGISTGELPWSRDVKRRCLGPDYS